MRSLLLFIFSLTGGLCLAQDSLSLDQADTLAMSRKAAFQPFISLDYGKLGSTAVGLDTKYEATLGALFFRTIEVNGSYGFGKLEPQSAIDNGRYTSEGSYYRVGVGFLKQFKPEAKIGIGLAYGSSDFDDRGDYATQSSTTSETFENSFDRSGLSAQFWEIVLTSESWLRFRKEDPGNKLNQLLAVGFNLRWRQLISYDRMTPIDVYTIPGYGITLNDNVVALNLFIKIYPF